MLPRTKRLDGYFGVHVRRQADVDGFDVGILHRLVGVEVAADIRKVELLAWSADVPLNVAEVSGEFLLFVAADRCEFRTRYVSHRLQVRTAHEAEPKHSNAHR